MKEYSKRNPKSHDVAVKVALESEFIRLQQGDKTMKTDV
jgi:hypothetical protein